MSASMSNAWNNSDRQRFADRDVLKAQTVPAKQKPAPEPGDWWDDEFGEDYWAGVLGDDTPLACGIENPDICESCQ